MEYNLSITDSPDEALRQKILGSLMDYNESKVGPANYKLLAVVLQNLEGEIIGGVWAGTGHGWLFTELAVIPENLRRQGVGSRMIRIVEQEAVARGCHSAWLDTFEFQARAFYEKLGYVVFGELPNYPTGYTRYFLKKKLK